MFLEITNPGQGLEVLGQWVPRARLGLHLRLAKLTQVIHEALMSGDSMAASRHISAYFYMVGLNVENATGVEQMAALARLTAMNALQHQLPFQSWPEPDEGPDEVLAYDYAGRTYAWWIHKLATRYGWTRQFIFDELWPEEAAAYLQEILVSEHNELEQERALSELSYKYDKGSQTSTFQALPKPGWMQPKREDKVFRIRKDMMPMGVVINLEDIDPKTLH